MTDFRRRDRARGALLGLAVGDALGVPLEFSDRDTHPLVTEIIGGGPFSLEPGCWTDDTSMALCLAESLLEDPQLDQPDLMNRFVRWWRTGENSVTGRCFDIGNATKAALARFETSGRIHVDPDPLKAGNGSLMRLSPVALVSGRDHVLAMDLARRQGDCTHGAPSCRDACSHFADLLVGAIGGETKHACFTRDHTECATAEVAAIMRGSYRQKSRNEVRSTGYVVDTLEAALWAVWTSDSFEEALVKAVNLAGDSDTIGAVAGQLAGALWGASAIPARWLHKLAWREKIEAMADRLHEAGDPPK